MPDVHRINYVRIVGIIAAALLLISPLIKQSLPVRTYIVWVSFPVLFAAVAILCMRGSLLVRQNVVLTGLLSLLLLSYLIGILRTEPDVPRAVYIEFANGLVFTLACLAVFQFLLRPEMVAAFLKGFKNVVIVYGLAIALLGALKQSLLASGAELSELATATPGSDKLYVPATTSLVTDYNFFSLSLLIAGIFALEKVVWAWSGLQRVLYSSGAAFILTVGFYSGSRRFWLTCIAVVVLVSAFLLLRRTTLANWAGIVLGITVGIGSYFAIQAFDPRPVLENNWVGRTVQPVDGPGQVDESRRQIQVHQQNYGALRNSLFSVGSEEHGMAARVMRWRYTFEYYRTEFSGTVEYMFGSGFEYFDDFGCRFSHCDIRDNPHSPILSALLYGGAFGAVIALAVLVYAGLGSAYLLMTSTASFGVPLSMTCAILFVSISGDSYYSMPVFLTMIALLQLSIISACKPHSKLPLLFR